MSSTLERTVLQEAKKLYSDTTLGVLRRLKSVVIQEDPTKLQIESDSARSNFLEILKEEVEKRNKRALKEGKNWEGKIEFSYFMGDEDGSGSWFINGIEIHKNTFVVFDNVKRSVYSTQPEYNVTEEEKIEGRISHNFERIFWVRYTNIKIFDGEPQLIEAIKVSFQNNQLRELSLVEATGLSTGLGSFYKKPEGPTREVKIKFKT